MMQKRLFRWLLPASAMCLPAVIFAQSMFTKITDPANPVVTFTNLPATYKGLAWINLDGDEWIDLFCAPKFIFKNLGGGQFQQLPDIPGAAGGQGAMGGSWGDVDNDGDPDLMLASLQSKFFRMNDTLGFDDHSDSLSNLSGYQSWDCAMADANADGLLDLLFVHAAGFHGNPAKTCRFFLQKTDGTFEQVTGYEFTDQVAPYTVPVWSDFDLDGDVDLFIGSGPAQNGAKPDFCYRNLLRETGTFALQRLTDQHWAQPQDGQVYNFQDYDNDGDFDVLLTNYSQAPTRFWQNDAGVYNLKTTPWQTGKQHLANVWGDVNHDGFTDVMMTTDANPALRFYANKGDGSFAAARNVGVAEASLCGAALCDYDNDGDLDAYVNGPGNARTLFRNDTVAGGRNWVNFNLLGTKSNRLAIGALLRLRATIGGKTRWQLREVQARNSFQSQNDLRVHFGLGDASVVDTLVVRWPSGLSEQFTALKINEFYKIEEGSGMPLGLVGLADFPEISISPNPTSGAFRVNFSAALSGNPPVRFEMFDSSGRAVSVQVSELGGQNWSIAPQAKPQRGSTYFLKIFLKNGATVTKPVVWLN